MFWYFYANILKLYTLIRPQVLKRKYELINLSWQEQHIFILLSVAWFFGLTVVTNTMVGDLIFFLHNLFRTQQRMTQKNRYRMHGVKLKRILKLYKANGSNKETFSYIFLRSKLR